MMSYQAACRALAHAKAVDEVKGVRDKWIAIKTYAKQAKNRQLELDAAVIRLRAERRVGELMAAQRASEGLATGGDAMKARVRSGPEVMTRPTLAEAGIDKRLADRARKLAAMPEPQFNELIVTMRISSELVSLTTGAKRSKTESSESSLRGTLEKFINRWVQQDWRSAAFAELLSLLKAPGRNGSPA